MTDNIKNTEALRLYNEEFVEKADAAINQAYERRAKMLKDIHVLDMSIADIEQARRSAMTSSILCFADDGQRDFDFNAQTHGEVLEMVEGDVTEAVSVLSETESV